MHRVRLGVAVSVTLAIAVQAHGSSLARAETVVSCNPWENSCKTIVTASGRPAQSSVTGKRGAATRNTRSSKADTCRTLVAKPQPAKSDPVWRGHRMGTILMQPCWLVVQTGARLFWAPAVPDGAEDPAVSPAVLAQRALAQLRIPKPVIHRSPGESATGAPVTWANLWTWVWTAPASWHQRSKTASLGPVWATVTVKPTTLTFHPGLGGAPVSCTGPGRAWTPADGDGPPTGGGCAYVYRSVSPGVRASLAIRWAVSWTGSGGSAGQLPVMTTRVSDRYAVEQIQAVNR